VAVLGNQYSVPIVHVGAPVAVRVHRDRIAIWRDTTRLAEHRRAPDGVHQRVVEPEHYSLLFAKKPRAQVMLYREALLQLGPTARWYMSELSHRRRAWLREEVVGIYTLYQQAGAERLLAMMAYATERSAYGVDYLRALMELAERPTWPALLAPLPAGLAPATAAVAPVTPVGLLGEPAQDEVDRALDVYEHYVQVDGADALDRSDAALIDIPAAVVVAGAREVAR
jgi:Mu transposase, C-terminal domain